MGIVVRIDASGGRCRGKWVSWRRKWCRGICGRAGDAADGRPQRRRRGHDRQSWFHLAPGLQSDHSPARPIGSDACRSWADAVQEHYGWAAAKSLERQTRCRGPLLSI